MEIADNFKETEPGRISTQVFRTENGMYSLDVIIAALDSREFEVTYSLAERLFEDLNGKSSLLGTGTLLHALADSMERRPEKRLKPWLLRP